MEELLKTLNEDLALNKYFLKKIANAIMEEEVSKYPIFVASRDQELAIGKLIVNKNENDMNWHINASHLEEFVNLNIINQEMVNQFKEVFKNPEEFMCLFVIYNEEGNFVFKPYSKSVLEQ